MYNSLERILVKICIIHFFLLIISQLLIIEFNIMPYVNKVVYYEGVIKPSISDTLETFKEMLK